MSEKRKDNKGRILKDGESQRSDGRYMYRYTDSFGKRQYAYAHSLDELREKEKQIRRDIDEGIDTKSSKISVAQWMDYYLTTRTGVRESSFASYTTQVNLIKQYDISRLSIGDVKAPDVRSFLTALSKDGYSYYTIRNIRSFLAAAFNMAIDRDMVRKNPFRVKLSDVIRDTTVPRKALSANEVNLLLEFVKGSGCYKKYFDTIVILLETGMRISELCALTLSDVDLENGEIRVNKQMCWKSATKNSNGTMHIERPKTKSGDRVIPIVSDQLSQALSRVITKRMKIKASYAVDGYTDFLFVDKNGVPRTAYKYDSMFRRMIASYNKSHSEKLPRITPHVCRHTFCTNKLYDGLDLKSLQYVMGHSDPSITIGTYSHADAKSVKEAFSKLITAES